MSYNPGTTINFIRNVKNDRDYENTYYFGSLSSQQNFFNSKTVISLNGYNIIKENTIKAVIPYNTALTCSYLSFRNSNTSDKWFYAFIDKVTYVNEQCVMITFTIDVIQSFLFDMQIHECFVERETTKTDIPGDNLIPEALSIGPLMDYDTFPLTSFKRSDCNVVVLLTAKPDSLDGWLDIGADIEPSLIKGTPTISDTILNINLYNGIPVPFYLLATDIRNSNFLISKLTKKGLADNIVACYYKPKFFVGEGPTVHSSNFKILETPYIPKLKSIGNFTPMNKKLLTSIFVNHEITVGGKTLNLKNELLEGNTYFQLVSFLDSENALIAKPVNYNGNTLESIIETKIFPDLTVVYDKRKNDFVENLPSKIYGLGASIAKNPGDYINKATDFALDTASVLFSPNNPAVSLNSSSSSFFLEVGTSDSNSVSINNMMLTVKSFSRNNLQQIDSYFTKYGYSVGAVKKVELDTRNRFNYVKTRESTITGNINNDYLKEIKNIFNSGVRFWHDYDDIGNYSINNSTK